LRRVDWTVSTATIVDGILSLISSSPGTDRDLMHTKTVEGGRNRNSLPKDKKAPLRELFRKTNDLAIYTAIENFFKAVDLVFWRNASEDSYIRKTVGIQALFDVLRTLLTKYFEEARDISIEFYKWHLDKAKDIDFSSQEFQAS